MRKYLIVLLLFLFTSHLCAQQTIEGKVMDAITSEPLPGVNIIVDGTSSGTITDFNGSFKLNNLTPDAILVFSYIGYNQEKITAGTQNQVTILMVPDIKELNEVVVIGYGSQKKSDLSGSVSVVSVDEMKKNLAAGIGEALQGQVPGVQVNSSGQPGQISNIRIRGIGSFSDVGPLYVVDGLILDGDQREFNPNDIESIQILKDASASAIYGSRGANGVIIITTKKGNEGEPRVEFSSSIGFQEVAHRLELMESQEWLETSQIAYSNAGSSWIGEPEDGDTIANTDWQDAFFQCGIIQDYNLSISKGGENSHVLLSVGYFDQKAVVKNPYYKRYSARINSGLTRGIFSFGENFLLSRSTTRLVNGSPFIDLARMLPVIPVYDEENESGYGYGSTEYPTYGSNPVGLQEDEKYTQTSNRLMGNMYGEISKWNFTYRYNLGIEYHNWYDRDVNQLSQVRYLSTSSYDDYLYEGRGDFTTIMQEHTLNYKNTFNKHFIEALAGYTRQIKNFKQTTAEGYNILDELYVMNNVSEDYAVGGSSYTYALISYLGRVNYSYDDRYLMQFNIRRDGSSRFGPDHRWGNFPSASAAWKISNEKFFSTLTSVISNLKFRASYGKIGDQQAISDYQYAVSITTSEVSIFGDDQHVETTGIQKGKESTDLHWEEKSTVDFGVDFGFFQNKLYGTFDYFDAKSTDLLVQLPLAWADGTDETPWTNYGSMTNTGIELSLGYRNMENDFKYNITANFTKIKNVVDKLGDAYIEAGTDNVNRTEVGRSIGEFYVIVTDGIFQNADEIYSHTTEVEGEKVLIQPNAQPGDVRYVDFNQDGEITDDDRQFVGSPLPKFLGGLNASIEYKGFDASIFITGVYGNKIFNGVKYWLERMDDLGNYPKGLNYWNGEGSSNSIPRPYLGTTDNAKQNSDRWIEDGSYLRLKNVQIGYTLPEKIVNKANIANCRIYLSGGNLYTLTKYSGFDPEISGNGVYQQGNDNGHFPCVRSYRLGMQLTF